MTNLETKFETLETQLATEHDETAAALAALQSALDLLNTQIDTLNVNGAANTKYLLAALGTLNPCTDCEGITITVPPTDTTPATQNEELCKRVQAFLHAMDRVFTVLDTMSTFGVGFSTSVLQAAFSEVITALGNGDTTPLPSFPEAVQLVGDGISYIAGNLLVGDTLVGLFTPLYFDLLKPMFAAGNAAAAQGVYNGVMDGSGYGLWEIPLMKHAAYNALYTYYFDPASAPNLTGYDGTICFNGIATITECTEYTSESYTVGSVTFQVVQVPPFSTLVGWGNAGDIFGFTFEMISDPGSVHHGAVYAVVPGPAENFFINVNLTTGIQTITGHTSEFTIRTPVGEGDTPHWTVRICPPS